jgi:hypothetical protein
MRIDGLATRSRDQRDAMQCMWDGRTYAGELVAAVTAFGDGASLLDVQVAQFAAGRLDHSDAVGFGVVADTFLSV